MTDIVVIILTNPKRDTRGFGPLNATLEFRNVLF